MPLKGCVIMSVNMVTSISEERLCTRKKTQLELYEIPEQNYSVCSKCFDKKNMKRKFDALNQFKHEYK